MKIPLKVERLGDLHLVEGVEKIVEYKVTNVNRFVVKDIECTIKTIKEDGKNSSTNYCRSITGLKTRLMPKDDFVMKVHLKTNKDYNETVVIDEVEENAARIDKVGGPGQCY